MNNFLGTERLYGGYIEYFNDKETVMNRMFLDTLMVVEVFFIRLVKERGLVLLH